MLQKVGPELFDRGVVEHGADRLPGVCVTAQFARYAGNPSSRDFVQVKPVHDGKTLGIATVYLQKADSGVKVTRIVWP
jgi:hypothetical protein